MKDDAIPGEMVLTSIKTKTEQDKRGNAVTTHIDSHFDDLCISFHTLVPTLFEFLF